MKINDIFDEALAMAWKHKYLWLVGMVAAVFDVAGSLFRRLEWYIKDLKLEHVFGSFPSTGRVLLIMAGMILVIIFLVMRVGGKIALIRAANQLDEGGTRVRFGSLMKAVPVNFWRVFSLDLLFGGSLILVFGGLWLLNNILLVYTFAILLSIIAIISSLGNIWLQLCEVAMVLEDRDFQTTLKTSWKFFWKKFPDILAFNFLLGLYLCIAGLIFLLPAFLIISSFSFLPNSDAMIIGRDFSLLIVVWLFVGWAVFFRDASLTLFFRRATGMAGQVDAHLSDISSIIPSPQIAPTGDTSPFNVQKE